MKKLILASILFLSLLGCSSDSVFEGLADESGVDATIEQAAIDLDNGNYEEVINSLAEFYTTTALNPDVARLLASGYMGKAGIDVTNFIFYSADEEADNFDSIEATLSLFIIPDDKSACNAGDRTVLIINGDRVYIDSQCIEELMDYLNNAKKIIFNLEYAGMETTEDIFKLGLTSAVHYVLFLGNATGKAVSGHAPINKEAYRHYKSDTTLWNNVGSSDFHDEDHDDNGWTRYQEDLINVHGAIRAIDQAISQPNDIRDELEAFLREVLSMPTGDITDDMIIETVTSTGIYTYVNSM